MRWRGGGGTAESKRERTEIVSVRESERVRQIESGRVRETQSERDTTREREAKSEGDERERGESHIKKSPTKVVLLEVSNLHSAKM